MLFWNHLGISFPLSTGSTGKTNFWVLWAGPDLTLTFMILTWPSPGTWTSRTPCISWYKSNYLNIRIFCIIRIFVHWFPKKRILFVIRIRPILISEYYSLFVFVPFSLFVATLVEDWKMIGTHLSKYFVRNLLSLMVRDRCTKVLTYVG